MSRVSFEFLRDEVRWWHQFFWVGIVDDGEDAPDAGGEPISPQRSDEFIWCGGADELPQMMVKLGQFSIDLFFALHQLFYAIAIQIRKDANKYVL